MPDIVIPLGNGSKSDNDELRILLRSIEQNAVNVGRVIIATDELPCFVNEDSVVHIREYDTFKHNKDANMINKVLSAVNECGVKGKFVVACDDNVFVSKCDLCNIPVLFNSKRKCDYDNGSSNRWQRRMYHTLEYLESRGFALDHNYECHAPQLFDENAISSGIYDIDYDKGIGISIFTLFRYLEGIKDGVNQCKFKETSENEDISNVKFNRMFLGYNDKSFLNGLREKLFKMFPYKSKYER